MIVELFSKRRKKLEQSGVEDVFQYDVVPIPLRVQMQQILVASIGPQYEVDPYLLSSRRHNPDIWINIHEILCREIGVHRLTADARRGNSCEDIMLYLEKASASEFLDVIEVCCKFIDLVIRNWSVDQRRNCGIKQNPDESLDEINYRFREACFGYSYSDKQIFRLDSEYSHEEIVKPALRLLRHEGYSGPQQEFLQAHAHYRVGEYPQAITEAAKAFESTLKAVCDKKGWEYHNGARVTDLLKLVRANGLWPEYLDTSFDQLIATLSSGLPKVRNEDGAHGQGSIIKEVPEYVASYALNLSAMKIRLIVEAAS